MKVERKTLVEIGVAALLLYLAIHYWDQFINLVGLVLGAATPLLLGGALAFIVNIFMSFLERHLSRLFHLKHHTKWLRPVCMLLSFITVALVLFLITRMIVPELTQCLEVLISAIPSALRTAARWAEDTLNISGLFNQVLAEMQAKQGTLQETLSKGLNAVLYGAGSVFNVVFSATSTVISSVISIFFGIVFAVHLLSGKEKLNVQFKQLMRRALPAKANRQVCHVLHTLKESFHSYIVCQLTEAFILGSLCALGMMIFGMPYALMIGCLIGVTALIPIAGAYIGGGIGAIMIFSVNPTQALWFIVFLVVLQQIEGNLIYPRVAGSSLGLPGIWVLVAITIGGGLLGILGMLISVPLTTTIYHLLQEHMNKPAPQKA